VSAVVHPSAVVDPGARFGEGVVVGPYAVVGPEVEVGDGCEIGAHAYVEGPTRLGARNRIFPHATLGAEPQDLKFAGERVSLEVGDGNCFREHVTVHRGTGKGGGVTRIGSDNLFMVYSHVAHDCRVGDRTVFANCATLAGHVDVGDDAVIGAFAAVQPFGRVGRHAYVGGFSRLLADALPFVKTVGMRPAVLGVNRIGLQRKGFDADRVRALQRAFRILLRSGLNTSQALERLEAEFAGNADVAYLIEFVRSARRGVVKTLPSARGEEDFTDE